MEEDINIDLELNQGRDRLICPAVSCTQEVHPTEHTWTEHLECAVHGRVGERAYLTGEIRWTYVPLSPTCENCDKDTSVQVFTEYCLATCDRCLSLNHKFVLYRKEGWWRIIERHSDR